MIATLAYLICASQHGRVPAHDPARTMYQVGTLKQLLDGKYDGNTPISDLTNHGDFGVGTFQSLDGEMVVLDGTVYQGDSYLNANRPGPQTLTPFGCVVKFKADITIPITHPMSSAALQELIDKRVGNPNAMLAVRVDGLFNHETIRAYPAQMKPYIPLGKLNGYESRFTFPSLEGTLVGNRLPKSVGTLNVVGYHFHFLSADHKRAGHVLGYAITSGTVRIMKLDGIWVKGAAH